MIYKINDEEFEFITILENSNNFSIFKHFKGNLYAIYTIAKDSEDLKDIVVYKAIDKDEVWIRDAKMFFSKVDKQKYPNVKEKYRFEKVK